MADQSKSARYCGSNFLVMRSNSRPAHEVALTFPATSLAADGCYKSQPGGSPGPCTVKTLTTLLGMMSLAMVSCDKKETVSQAPALPKKTSEFHPVSSSHSGAKPVSEPEIVRNAADASAAPPQVTPPPAIEAVPANPKPDQSALVQATEQLRQERLARMAKAREERAAQMSAAMTERYKQQDANGDGLLAKDEVSGRMQQRFTEADKNGDGFLDASEQQAMIQSVARRMSEGGGMRRGGNRGGGGMGNRGQ